MNHLIIDVNNLLRGHGFDYAICGGFAIDLFLDIETRKHGDIDVLAYWNDRNAIISYMQSIGWDSYEMCGGGKVHHITDINDQFLLKRNIFCIKLDCDLVQFEDSNDKDIYFINFDHKGQEKMNFIEFLFNDKTETHFLYARNENVKREINKAILFNDEISYLAPELILLYKSTDTERTENQADYDNAIQKMSQAQKEWLINALKIMNPKGHKWISAL